MKTAQEIYEEMKAVFKRESGREISDDCDMAVRMYAAAAQAEALYAYGGWVKEQCFPQTATGGYLDRHAQMRGVIRNGAVFSEGSICFYINEASSRDIQVPAGTVCMTESGIYFETVSGGAIAAGDTYAEVPARAMEPGSAGNVMTGTVVFMSPAPVGVTACANTAPFTGGADAEDDESLRARVLASYMKLPNGANKAYYESEALAVSGVKAVAVLPKNRGIGTVDVVISAADGVPDEALVAAVKNKLDGAREICVDIDVKAPETAAVDVSCRVEVGEGYSFDETEEKVKTAIRAYFDGGLLGKTVTRAALGNLVYGVEGVINYELSAPAQDFVAESTQLPVLGSLDVSEWS